MKKIMKETRKHFSTSDYHNPSDRSDREVSRGRARTISKNMASSTELAPLRKTVDALKEIRKQILPFLRVIESSENDDDGDDDSKHDPHTLAEARAAVALAVGTLRHMGARLGGRGGGGTGDKNDPLRLELERMRKMLVTLRKVDKRGDTNKSAKQSGNNDAKKKSASGANSDSKSERSKRLDEVASKADTVSDMNSSPNKDQKRKKKKDSDESSSGKKKRRKRS